MLFNSFIFFIFLAVVLIAFFLLPSGKLRKTFLVISSYVFYGYWDWRFCTLLLTSTLVDFIIAQKILSTADDKYRYRYLLVSVIVNLGILIFFKYFNFFADSLIDLSSFFGIQLDYVHLNIILPVGISFYTFQSMSYTIDVYKKRMKPTRNLVNFSLYVSFFPQLVAGPIERASSILKQLNTKLNPTKNQLWEGTTLIILGLFRKVIIGDTAGRYVDHIYYDLEAYKSIEILAVVILFSIQIYADFSGYSQIARGVAKLFGLNLSINFSRPYLAQSIREFWRKWHISLSTWLRDYVYIPLGGNQKGKSRMYQNLAFTMLLGGLWHGASWNFVIWGALHGLYLILFKFFVESPGKRSDSRTFKVIKTIGTFILVSLTWVFFRAEDLQDAFKVFEYLIFWESSEYSQLFIQIIFAYVFLTFSLDLLEWKYGKYFLLKVRSIPVRLAILSTLFGFTLVYMFQATPAPFIYFQF